MMAAGGVSEGRVREREREERKREKERYRTVSNRMAACVRTERAVTAITVRPEQLD